MLGLDPWIAKNLGEVEAGDFALMPPTIPSVGRWLHASALAQLALLALPFLALLVLLLRPGLRIGSRALDYAAMSATIMLGTFAITVLGDGLADAAKQGHLIVNTALAWLIVTAAAGLATLVSARMSSTPKS